VSLKRVLHFLGFLIYFLALLMVPAAIPAYVADDPAPLAAFFHSAVGTLALGAALRLLCRGADSPRGHDAFGIVVFGWILSAIVCAAPFVLAGRAGVVDSFFESMSGLTTTGATIFKEIEKLPPSILLWRSMTQWLGGMGIILVASVLLSFMESQGLDVLRAEASLVSQKIAPRLVTTGLAMVRIYLLFTAANLVLLAIGGLGFFDSLCHALTTLPTGGYSTKNASIGHYRSLYVEVVTVVFMVVGGTNFFLHYQALRGRVLAYFRSSEFRAMIVWMFASGVAIAAILVLFGNRDLDGPSALRQGLFQSISFTTSSGHTTADHGSWPAPARFLLLLTMIVGGCVGSTAGGFKFRRWLIVFKALAREALRVMHPNRVMAIRVEGEAVDEAVVRKFVLLLLLWLGMSLAGGAALLLMNVDPETAFSASASCVGNIGPALGGATSNMAGLPDTAKMLLAALMLVGRLEIFVVIALLSPVVWRQARS
jgi:trk system potassium uptake protein TrkH